MEHFPIVDFPTCHILAVVAAEATLQAYPLKPASFCISLHFHRLSGVLMALAKYNIKL